MPILKLVKGSREAKFLHLLDLRNMKVIFSKDRTGVRVEVCETKDKPPYIATLKFSFYISETEYSKIAKKHQGIMQKMMQDLSNLSRTIEKLYNSKRKSEIQDGNGEEKKGR
ncbi:MAG: hypothetical protein V1820_02015 [archaeon]